jgi:hypothetical protein
MVSPVRVEQAIPMVLVLLGVLEWAAILFFLVQRVTLMQ